MTDHPPRPPDGSVVAALTVGEGRARVVLTLLAQGRDLVLLVGGGDSHAGAVAVRSPAGGTRGEPCEALAVVPGHREGPLAAEAATAVAAATGRTCVVVAGIHQDGAAPVEIAAIVANVREGCARLVARLRAGVEGSR